MGGVASYLTPSVRVLCSLLVPFLRCVQLPMLSILQREQRERRGEQMEQDRGRSLRRNKQ